MESITKILLFGLLPGIILTLFVLFLSMPSLMFKESKSKYDFATTVAELEKSVQNHAWKIPQVNDLQETMKMNGKDVRQVKVFSLCQPDHAYSILNQDDERIVSSLMPCRVAVYEKTDGVVYLSRMNAGTLSKPMNTIVRKTMKMAAKEIEQILEPIID